MKQAFTHLSAPESSIQYLMGRWRFLVLNPHGLRKGPDWTEDKQQCFIDSILRGFDTSQLYFRPVEHLVDVDGERRYINYDVMDGRQRLLAIQGFHDGLYGIPADSPSLKGRYPDGDTHAVTLAELKKSNRDLYIQFVSYHLNVVSIGQVDDDTYNEFISRRSISGTFSLITDSGL